MLDGIDRVDVLNILGVLVQSNLAYRAQVDRLVGHSAQTLYALRILRHHGLQGPQMREIASAALRF